MRPERVQRLQDEFHWLDAPVLLKTRLKYIWRIFRHFKY